jgi:hypothetical protein
VLLPASDDHAKGPPKTNERVMCQNLNSEVAVIDIDIGRNSFQVVGK